MSQLKRAMLDEYKGFADKRIKKLEKGSEFIVDFREEMVLGADRKPLAIYCLMFADVKSDEEVELRMAGNIPLGEKVKEWLTANGVRLLNWATPTLYFTVTPDTLNKLDSLADAIMSIVASGVRYSDASYKYACPETAGSLKRLKSVLELVWLPEGVTP